MHAKAKDIMQLPLFIYIAVISSASLASGLFTFSASSAISQGGSLVPHVFGILTFLPLYNNLMRVLQAGILVLLLIYVFKGKGISNFSLVIILFYAFHIIPTALNGDMGALKTYVLNAMLGLSATMLIDVGFRTNAQVLVRAARNVLFAFLCLNVASMFVFPNGFLTSGGYDYFFLGMRLKFLLFVMAAMFFTVVYDVLFLSKKFSRFTAMVMLLCAVNIFYKTVITGIIFFLIINLAMLCYNKAIDKILSFKLCLAVFSTVFIMLVVFSVQYQIADALKPLGIMISEKTLSLDARVPIWNGYMRAIREHPIIGHGIGSTMVLIKVNIYSSIMLSSHNHILDVLYEGGFVALAVFVYMFLMLGSEIKKIRPSFFGYMMMAFIIGIWTTMINEPSSHVTLYYMIIAGIWHACRHYAANPRPASVLAD